MGGIRISGGEHWILGNTFQDLRDPRGFDYWPISMRAASDETVVDGGDSYARVRDVVIAGNTFVRSHMPPIAIGTGQQPDRPFLPTNVLIMGNTFEGKLVYFEGGSDRYTNVTVK
jgi:hypothetical protein